MEPSSAGGGAKRPRAAFAWAHAVGSHALWGAYPAAARLTLVLAEEQHSTSFVAGPVLTPTALTLLSVLPISLLPLVASPPACSVLTSVLPDLSRVELVGVDQQSNYDNDNDDDVVVLRLRRFALSKRVVLAWRYWACVLAAFARSLLNIVASSLARAFTCQMLMLFTPFCVIALDRLVPLFWNTIIEPSSPSPVRDSLPKRMLPAMVVSICGAMLMLWAGSRAKDASSDTALGVFVAALGPVIQAVFMHLVGPVARTAAWEPMEAVFWVNAPTIILAAIACVFAGDRWSSILSVLAAEPALAAATALVAFLRNAAHLLQQSAIQRIGAPFVSSLMPLRMVAAVVAGFVLLGESFTSVLQLVGAVAVTGAIAWYLAAPFDTPSDEVDGGEPSTP